MDESTISQINAYKRVVEQNIDDFVEFLYSQKVIEEKNYFDVWNEGKHERISVLFSIIHSKENLDNVLKYLKHTYPNHEKKLKEERNFRISLIRGGFPELPPNYVSRKSLVEDVKSKLQDLKWNNKLVIHGMMGYGKSCLINDVLRDQKVTQYFDNNLFWINLGDCHSKEDVWQPMWRLYVTASSVLEKKIHCQDDLQTLKDSLTNLFLEERLKNSIIILDDVDYKEVLNFFDIKCKTVITTQNRHIFYNSGSEVIFVKVKTGFSTTESLELFKKSLKISYDLPSAAEEIHSICQGHPMLISLIGSYLNENATEVRAGDIQIWTYIKELFLKGIYRLNEYNDEEVDISQIIKNCIEKLLTNNVKDLYKDFAIFEQDVNIPSEVLQILWNKNPFEVKNIMNTLAEKSLIVPFFHNDLKTYIYGIHELYLNYLKGITAKNRKDLHRKLIAGYDRITNENYALLPDDNYTLQFIGYHIFHAEEFDKFQIYFNLKFLESKLKAAGKEDVLRDMQKYEVYITRGENTLKEKLKQYKDFIKRCGASLYTYDKTDIIQYALRENKDSFVFRDALNIAKKSSRLYFQLQKPCEELDYSSKINISDDITSACFVDSLQHILIGTTNGKIKLFYEQSAKEISQFIGHVGAITHLIISPDKGYFLSVSIDGTVMLWKFAADSSRNSRDFTNYNDLHPQSPKTKQSYWVNMYTADRGEISPRKRFKLHENDDYLISAAFCDNFPDTFQIVTGSVNGNVILWDAMNEKRLYQTGRRGYPVPCVLHIKNEDDEYVVFGCEESIFKYKLINEQLHYYSQLHNTENCNSIFLCQNTFLAVSDKRITHWEKTHKTVTFENKDDEKKNICSTLTNDNQYLIVSTNQKTIYVWDIIEEKVLREFENKGLAKSLDTFYDEDKSVHILLIGSDKKKLQQCHIQPHEMEPQVENMPKFIPFWKKKNVLTALVSHHNKLQVFSSYILLSESEILNSQITCTCFSVCGNSVIYGMRNGQISIFDIRSKLEMTIQKPNNMPVTFLKCIDTSNTYKYHKPASSRCSSESLDYLESYTGVIVAIFGNNMVSIYNDVKVFSRKMSSPVIFHCSKLLLVLDSGCNLFTWNIETDVFLPVKNSSILEPVTLSVATYCSHKSYIGAFYSQMNSNFFDTYYLNRDSNVLERKNRIVMFNEKVKSATFSCDGKLLALGMNSGAIKIYNIDEDYNHISLNLHEDPIRDLIFAPYKEPILISLAEEIAWWTLRSFPKSIKKNGRPNSLDILENLSSDLNTMDISFWSDREPQAGSLYLLSFIKLKDKAKFMSASNDFNSFLVVDETGKVYILEIIHSEA